MSEKKTTSKKVHTLTLEDQTKLAQANVKKMEQGKIEVMKVVEGVQGAEKLAELIERGKKNGKLSSSELMDVLENLDLESDQMDKIYDTLENLGIDTVGDDYLPELADDIMPPLEELNEIEELPEEEMVDPNTLVDSFGIDDPVRMYLKEIGKVNLLTPDEEIQLAQDMGAGDAAKEQMEELEQARKNGEEVSITEEEEKELRRLVKRGEAAKQRLAEANLRLVVSIAKRYVGRGMLFLDLIQEGNLGYQITFEAGSREFVYLTESFNQMSSRLKYQFDHIYQEEMALKDARIMALQSHINPHFMNNTLEIINWEARLSGNMKISKMIESLSVLMNAAMDRKRRHVVPLKEELQYVEAYLHIMKERLGSKLTVEVEIAEDTLNEKVPRLILQPVIENAIEHGVIRSGSGTVVLRSYKKGDYLYLETENNGVMNEQERAKVDRLLAPDYDTSKESSGNLGIANVNQRLGILYGEPCGLAIFQEKDDRICARLTIFVGLRAQ